MSKKMKKGRSTRHPTKAELAQEENSSDTPSDWLTLGVGLAASRLRSSGSDSLQSSAPGDGECSLCFNSRSGYRCTFLEPSESS